MEKPRLISIGEVKAITGLHPDTIRKYESSGQFPKSHRVGKRKYWHIDNVNEWVAKFKN